MIYSNILEAIGNTPIVRLNKVVPDDHHYFAKIEYLNPGGSVKDRLAIALIDGAEKRGELRPGGIIVEATSGNTGIGLAMVAAIRGYKCIFVMPAKISEEKRAILRAYGAKVVITPTGVEPEDPLSHYSVAKTIAEKTPNSFYTNQYHNPDNLEKHYQMTGPEIWKQMNGDIDIIVDGAGTGGTLSGCAKFLKEKNPNIKVLCTDPIGSILYDLFYHKKVIEPAKPYLVEGIGEDMLPENVKLNLYSDFVQVTDQESFDMTRRLAFEEGLCVGPSSGNALAGAIKYGKTLKKKSKILVIFPDSGRVYVSKAFNTQWLEQNNLLKKKSNEKEFNIELPAEQMLAQLK